MAEIVRVASAGTLESSDVYVEIEPWEQGVEIQLESVVKGQFGGAIESAVRATRAARGVERARLTVSDRGALECVIRARVETAVARGREGQA